QAQVEPAGGRREGEVLADALVHARGGIASVAEEKAGDVPHVLACPTRPCHGANGTPGHAGETGWGDLRAQESAMVSRMTRTSWMVVRGFTKQKRITRSPRHAVGIKKATPSASNRSHQSL